MRKSHIVLIVMLTAVTFGIAGCSHVTEDWKAAQAADTSEAYQDFLRQHPDSEFGLPAQERLKQLAEDRDWQQASKTDTLDAYQQFVATHADGKWAQEARVRIENFQLTASGQAPPAVPGADGVVNAPIAATAMTPAAPAMPVAKPAPAATAKPAAAASPKPAPAKPAAGRHFAQLGAFGSKAGAAAAWRKVASRFPGELKSLQPHYVVVRVHAKSVVRLQVGVASSQRAHELCASLKRKSQACVPVG